MAATYVELHGFRGLNVSRFGGLSDMGLSTIHVNLMAVPQGTTIPRLSHNDEMSRNETPILTGKWPMNYIR